MGHAHRVSSDRIRQAVLETLEVRRVLAGVAAVIDPLPQNTLEGAAVTLTGRAVDQDDNTVAVDATFKWEIRRNNDQYIFGTGSSFTFTPDDNRVYDVILTATTPSAESATSAATLPVGNVAPTGTFLTGHNFPMEETRYGSTWVSRVTFRGTDPSKLDTAAGLRYSFDFNDDGTYEVVNSTSGVANVPAALLADGPSSYVVRGRVADKDGGVTEIVQTYEVQNLAPYFNFTATHAAGGPAEGLATTVRGTIVDSAVDAAAGFTDVNWKLTGPSGDVLATGSGREATVVPPDNGSYWLTFKATDKDGAVGSSSYSIVAASVAPTATFTSNGPVNEGSPATVSFNDVTDSSPADLAAGLRYSYDFDNNGTFEIASSADASAVVPASYLPDGPASRIVRGRVSDKDGAFRDYITTVDVLNVAPVAEISGPADVIEGQNYTYTALATDSPGDVAAGIKYAWRLLNTDGSVVWTSTPTMSIKAITFAAPDNGSFVLELTATDRNGGSSVATKQIAAANRAPTATFTSSFTGSEGSTATLTLAQPSDGANDLPGLRYSFDTNNDGDFDDAGEVSQSPTNNVKINFTDNGVYTVRGRIADKDGAYTDYVRAITVYNQAPSVGAVREPTTNFQVEGREMAYEMIVTDVSPVDTAAGFTIAWNVTRDGLAYTTGEGYNFAFTPGDQGYYTVTATAVDKDGGRQNWSRSYVVNNVAPTAAIAGPTSGAEGQALSYAAVAGDVPGDVLTYAWTATRNGSVFATGTDANFAFTPGDNGNYAVTLSVTDKDGAKTAASPVAVAVANTPPVVTINPWQAAGGTEGQSMAYDAVATDAASDAATLTYSWSATRNGTVVNSGTQKTFSYVALDNGTYVVSLTVRDKDGGVTTVTRTENIASVPPTVTISGPASAKRNKAASYTFSAWDASATDRAAGFTYAVDWNGDGKVDQTVKGGAAFSLSYKYANKGVYDLTVTAYDKDGVGATSILRVTVT